MKYYYHKWLHTLFNTSWCAGVSKGALKEAISFASICSSQLFLTDGSDISSQMRSLHESIHMSSNWLLMSSWTSDRLLPNTFSWLTCSNCCDNVVCMPMVQSNPSLISLIAMALHSQKLGQTIQSNWPPQAMSPLQWHYHTQTNPL
jgi:hypothetical protein